MRKLILALGLTATPVICEEAVKPWKHFLISDKRFCDNCHTRRNPTGGEWKPSKDGLRRTWECGVCVGKRNAVFDAYEFTDTLS